MLKTKGSKTSASEEIQGRYSEETQGNCLCNLYIVINMAVILMLISFIGE
jgi:hypothetical protein